MDQRPCVAVIAFARVRENRRGRFSGPRRLEAAARPQRLPGIVRHLTGPDEIPEGGKRDLAVEPGRREEVEPEERAVRERRPDRRRVPPPRGGGSAPGRPSAGASSRK